MGDGRFLRASLVLLVPAALAGLAACSSGGGHAGGATASAAADKAVSGGFSPADLKGALLTKVNGVGAASPATSGSYASMSGASAGKTAAGGVTVTPKACAGSATEGFDPAALSGFQAAAVSFKVSGNAVSEVLVASTAKAGTTALAGSVPKQCATYKETVDGKTFTYTLTQQNVTGIGQQARILDVHSASTKADSQWSLVYRGKGFVGTVTVIGPNASEAAVRELGQQAYAFAAKSLT
jgi:hypothetical protein